jgi:branched-chain amino acid aminotransferase
VLQDGGVKSVWCDEKWIDGEHATVQWADRGWMHGLGLFETILAMEGRVVFLDRHLARLRSGLGVLGWDVDVSAAGEAMGELLKRNGLSSGRARIRLAVSGGVGLLRDPGAGIGRMVWMTAARADEPPDSVVVGISRWKRNECSPLAGLKCASYAENLLILKEAADHGWDEALLFNHAGHVCEAATANVFLVMNGNVTTPPLSSGCLPGVTRAVVLEGSKELGIPCTESDLSDMDLAVADEIFLTSSTRGVVPVRGVGDRSLGLGPVAERLREELIRKMDYGQDARATAGEIL